MSTSRKYVNSMLSSVQFLKAKYENMKNDIVSLTSQAEYEQTIQHYDTLQLKLSAELLSLPVGYRYTGSFYIKKPYVLPVAFAEHYGTIFMREDLVSWLIESGVEPNDYSYHRTLFKVPKEGSEFELKREDAEPVYTEASNTSQ